MGKTPRNQVPGASASVASGISRRTFIGAAGALGITAATMRALPARAAAASQFLGSNADVFLDIQSAVPGLHGVRIYGEAPNGNTNQLASQWPGGPSPTTEGPIVYSIYPIPDTVLGGPGVSTTEVIITNQQIQHIIDTAPPNSYLDSWHEAFGLTYPSYITVSSMHALHSALNQKCQGSNVTYGSIFGGGNTTTLWDSVPDDLGFYGFDVYANISIDDGMNRLENFIAMAKQKAKSGYPKLLIPETNTPTVSDRPTWFTDVCTRMHQYGSNSIGVLTFWGGTGAPLSGPWLPNDSATIRAMNNIINNIF